MAGKGQKKPAEPVVVDGIPVDAVWIAEWVTQGFKELGWYLACYAKFNDWCDHHPPTD